MARFLSLQVRPAFKTAGVTIGCTAAATILGLAFQQRFLPLHEGPLAIRAFHAEVALEATKKQAEKEIADAAHVAQAALGYGGGVSVVGIVGRYAERVGTIRGEMEDKITQAETASAVAQQELKAAQRTGSRLTAFCAAFGALLGSILSSRIIVRSAVEEAVKREG